MLAPEPTVVYEDGSVLVINKPAGLLVHAVHRAGGVLGDDPTVVTWARAHTPEIGSVGDDPAVRPGIVHRLDQDTSGVMVIAKTKLAFEHLKKLFQNRGVEKTYLAWVWGRPAKRSMSIVRPIGIISGTTRRSIHSPRMAKEATTEYVLRRVEHLPDGAEVSLLEVRPRTGRTHQIRVHLASIGHPIVGDRLYGRRSAVSPSKRLLLHASRLVFNLPSGRPLQVEAAPPADFVLGGSKS